MDEYTVPLAWAKFQPGMTVELRHEIHPTVVGRGGANLHGLGLFMYGVGYYPANGWSLWVKPQTAPTLPPEPACGTRYVLMGGSMPITRGVGALHFRAGWDDEELGGKTWREVAAWHQEAIDDPEDDTVGPFVVEELMTKSMWETQYPRVELRERKPQDAPVWLADNEAMWWVSGWNSARGYMNNQPSHHFAADTQINNKLLTINGEDNTHE